MTKRTPSAENGCANIEEMQKEILEILFWSDLKQEKISRISFLVDEIKEKIRK